MNSSTNEPTYHVVLFPFMAKGHTIQILHFARLLLRREITVTIFTTPSNLPFLAETLSDVKSSFIELPFPNNEPEIPARIESTDSLPSISLWPLFVLSTKLMQPAFERKFEALPPVNFIVSDGFLWWILESANKLGIPRLVFFGTSSYAACIGKVVHQNNLLHGPELNEELITVTPFPWIKITKGDFFYEIEKIFVDYWNNQIETWCVGPLCLVDEPNIDNQNDNEPTYIQWLDKKLEEKKEVLYVAFGTQTEISIDQLNEIAIGLEESMANFLWVMRNKNFNLEGYEERVKGRGIIVKEWVDQKKILKHKSVVGFLSHCGWKSVLESICEGVPILAWPMIAEQPLNAKMVVEEIKIGLRLETSDGSVRGLVKSEGLKKMVKELINGR